MATRHLSVLLCLTSALLPTPLVASSARGFRVVEVRDRAGHELGRFGSSLALVIHVSRYQDASWGDLPSAALEAETISSALSDNGFAVTRLENPTSDDLSRGLNGLVGASVADKTGRMVIFFAGHGHQRDGPFGGRKKGYLVPADAPHPDKGLEGFTAKALEMSDLVALCSKLECSHALFVLDCPFSSTVLASRGVGVRKADIPAYISERVLLPVRQFIAVTAEQERTRNRESFAEAFVLALDGAADRDDDGYVLGTELGHYFEAELSSWRKGQSAEFGKMRHPLWDRGDFCFVVPRTGLAGSEYQALQRFLRDHGHYKGTIDGLPGTETWRALQALLRQRGYYRGEPDGVPGSLTREALKVLQARIRIAQTGRLDSATVEAIGAGRVPQIQTSVPPLSPEQGTGTEVALPEAVTPGEDTKVSGLDLELAWIAPGTFRMGALDGNSDERPVHPVRIPQGFWMGRCEITNQQYQTFVAEAAYDGLEDADGDYLKHLDEGNALSHGGRLPVVWVNWNNCVAFCDWLTSHEQEAGRLPAGYVFRLPTEAEWEYAARAGTATPYSFGNDPSQLSRYGNFCDRSSKLRWRDLVGDDGYSEAAPVGSLRHNGWGMHDMHGNVWEWCLDRYDGRFYSRSPIENPSGPVAGDSRVARGGSWRNNSTQCRSSMRISVLLPSTRPVLGFRVVLAPPVVQALTAESTGEVTMARSEAGVVHAEGNRLRSGVTNPTTAVTSAGAQNMAHGTGTRRRSPKPETTEIDVVQRRRQAEAIAAERKRVPLLRRREGTFTATSPEGDDPVVIKFLGMGDGDGWYSYHYRGLTGTFKGTQFSVVLSTSIQRTEHRGSVGYRTESDTRAFSFRSGVWKCKRKGVWRRSTFRKE